MGSRMTVRLLNAGHDVTVWNRTPEKTRPLVEAGAAVAASPAEAAAGKDMVLCNLTDGAALEHVVQGPGAFSPRIRSPVCSLTSRPSLLPISRDRRRSEASGVAFLRAPVSGTTTVAEACCLTLTVSGERAVLEAPCRCWPCSARPRIRGLGGEVALSEAHTPDDDRRQHAGVGGGIGYGGEAGLDWQVMLDVIGNSAVASGAVKGKSLTLAARDYENPAMSMHNIAKDLDLALEAAAGVGVELPATQKVRDLYDRSMAAGREWQDYSAIVLDLEKRAGLEPQENPT